MVYIMDLLDVSVWPEGLVALHKVESFMRGLMTASNLGASPSPPKNNAHRLGCDESILADTKISAPAKIFPSSAIQGNDPRVLSPSFSPKARPLQNPWKHLLQLAYA